MANIITQWLNPNNFSVLRDKVNAVVSVLSGGTTNQVIAKFGPGNGEFVFKSIFDLMPTGQPWRTLVTDLTLPPFNSQWIASDGRTLGSLASTADLKGDQYKNLFLFTWNNIADISAFVTGGRGTDALADYNANKKIAIPDYRGLFTVGHDPRLSNPPNDTWDLDYNSIGKKGGRKRVKLTGGESGQKQQDLGLSNWVAFDDDGNGSQNVLIGNGRTLYASDNVILLEASADDEHENRPPYIVENVIIKL